jgi:hypothetical protein
VADAGSAMRRFASHDAGPPKLNWQPVEFRRGMGLAFFPTPAWFVSAKSCRVMTVAQVCLVGI